MLAAKRKRALAAQKGKSPAKPRKNPHARCEVGSVPSGYWLNPVHLHRGPVVRPGRHQPAHVFSPESGCAVSEVVENLSRKIRGRTTKYPARRAQSVYP